MSLSRAFDVATKIVAIETQVRSHEERMRASRTELTALRIELFEEIVEASLGSYKSKEELATLSRMFDLTIEGTSWL